MATSAVLFALLPTRSVRAGGEDGVPLSVGAAIASTMIVLHDSGTGSFYNPAALAGLGRSSIQVSMSFYSLAFRQADELARATLPWGEIRDSPTSTDFTSVPSGISMALRLSDSVGVSAGLFTTARDYYTLNRQRTSEGVVPELGLLRYEQLMLATTRTESTHAGIGLGITVGPRFRLGGSLFVLQESIEASVHFAFALHSETDQMTLRAVTTNLESTNNVFALQPRLGAQWEVSSAATLALAVRAPAVRLATTGMFQSSTLAAETSGPFYSYAEGSLDLPRIVRPVQVSAALALRARQTRVFAEGDFRSKLSTVGLGADEYIINGRAGFLHKLSDNLTFGAGVFTDLSGAARHGVNYYGGTAGVTLRSSSVVRALRGSSHWDMRSTLAIRYGEGIGTQEGFTFDPIAGTAEDHDAPLRSREVSVNLGTALEF